MVSAVVRDNFEAVGNVFSGGVDDPYAIYTKMRRESPVMEGDLQAQYGVASQAADPTGRRPIYTLFKYNDIMRVLRDPETFTSGLMMEKYGKIVGSSFLPGLDGEEHRITRALLSPSFSRSKVEGWKRTLIAPLARDQYVLPLKPLGECDILSDIAIPFPIHVIYQIIGFPNDPEMLVHFGDLGLQILQSAQGDPTKAAAAAEVAARAAKEFYDMVLPIVAERRRTGADGDDLISNLFRANTEGRTLDDDSITCFIRMLIPGAAETTTRTFGVLMTELLRTPGLWARLQADRTLIPKAVAESQRLEPANAFVARQAMRSVTLSGVTIPAGAGLLLATASANRDEEIFENADQFDLDRPPQQGLQFGFGMHLCMGIHTARAEIEVMLDAILDHWPNLRANPAYASPKLHGMHFRGPDHLQVVWDRGH
jgi:cytochrome P450